MAELTTKFNDPVIGIENWSALAKGAPKDGIYSLFSNSGNHFSFNISELNIPSPEKLHVYFALNNLGTIDFLVIPDDLDKEGCKVSECALYPVPLQVTTQKIPNNIGNELVGWINNWCNETIRNTWIKNTGGNGNMVQVLVIGTKDFMVNDTHECFFGLRLGTDSEYVIDLVVRNTATGQVLNLVESTSTDGTIQYLDMARPVPPFDIAFNAGHISTVQSNFSLLS